MGTARFRISCRADAIKHREVLDNLRGRIVVQGGLFYWFNPTSGRHGRCCPSPHHAGRDSLPVPPMIQHKHLEFPFHEFVWWMSTGAWPSDKLTFIDGDVTNHRFINLTYTEKKKMPPVTKPLNKMSRRERLTTQKAEVRYALQLIGERLRYFHQAIGGTKHIFIGLTTPSESRKLFEFYLVKHLQVPFVVLASGRIGAFDGTPEESRPVYQFLDLGIWSDHKYELKAMFDSLLVLIDADSYINTAKGSHAIYCRHFAITGREMSESLKNIVKTYSNLKEGALA